MKFSECPPPPPAPEKPATHKAPAKKQS
jgi:hypothetical protein